MLNPDFSDRTYTVEVLKTKSEGAGAFDSLVKLTSDPEFIEERLELSGPLVRICHGFLTSEASHHRFARVLRLPGGAETHIPRTKVIKGKTVNLYDVLIAHCRRHIVIAVPFHDLAEEFFPKADVSLGGTGTKYEKLDITAMVIRMGKSGSTDVLARPGGVTISLSITRCHLAYADQNGRTSNIQQIRMTGTSLGDSKEYRAIIAPVLDSADSPLTVTPVVLGFAFLSDGVRKSGATTDRHGNFKLWVAPGLRRLIRIFDLLSTLEEMKNITSTTTNVPILQSKTIRDAED